MVKTVCLSRKTAGREPGWPSIRKRERLCCYSLDNLHTRSFDLLKIRNQVKQVASVRIPLWAEHPHQAFGRTTKGLACLDKSHSSVDEDPKGGFGCV